MGASKNLKPNQTRNIFSTYSRPDRYPQTSTHRELIRLYLREFQQCIYYFVRTHRHTLTHRFASHAISTRLSTKRKRKNGIAHDQQPRTPSNLTRPPVQRPYDRATHTTYNYIRSVEHTYAHHAHMNIKTQYILSPSS